MRFMADETITPELRQFVNDEVRAGHFPSEDHVVAEALLQMKERRQAEAWLRAKIDQGVASLERGEGKPFDTVDTKRRLLERLKAKGVDVTGYDPAEEI
jgi:putative addiction module CopG family antidote